MKNIADVLEKAWQYSEYCTILGCTQVASFQKEHWKMVLISLVREREKNGLDNNINPKIVDQFIAKCCCLD